VTVLSPVTPLVSIVIPAFHAAASLRSSVASAVAQASDQGELEVIVVVGPSAPDAARMEADALAAADACVVVAVAASPGAAAARHAGVARARGSVIVFLGDECVAGTSWLSAGVRRLRDVDLVQGRTVPPDGPGRGTWDRTVRIERLSGLWESCNLFVRRTALDLAPESAAGPDPTRPRRTSLGEDAEWGWRLVRAGATFAFEPDAVVEHALMEQTYRQWLVDRLRVRDMPLVVREAPEVRGHLMFGYIADRAQLRAALTLACLGAAGAAAVARRRRLARALLTAAVVPVLQPARWHLARAAEDTLAVGAALYGSIRYRRLVL
jgi:glycosyltransferase involved in cell wall biosynthesis